MLEGFFEVSGAFVKEKLAEICCKVKSETFVMGELSETSLVMTALILMM